MKKVIQKIVELITNAETHADHRSIRGKKSGGVEDQANFKNWRKSGSGGTL